MESQQVATMIRGLKRKFSLPVLKKKAVTPDLVRECMAGMIGPSLQLLNLVQMRNLALFSVMYFMAAHFEEAADLLTENIMVSPGGNLELLFIKSKTNQFKGARSSFLTPHEGAGPVSYTHLTLPTICSV